MGVNRYRKITVHSDRKEFSVFSTQESLDHRNDEVVAWVKRLAGRLRWTDYEATIVSATEEEAKQREHALFEHRYPDS